MTLNAFEKKNIRLDLYLFYIRIFKSRNLATKFIISNRLRISGQVTQKPHKLISIGDVLSLPIQDYVKILKVVDIPKRRGPFSEALNYYEDITPLKTQENKVNVTPKFKFVERVGRPTKLERRQTDKLMGRD
ncbi:S4 domain-containing protein [Alphaproteobacteria bacterium]|jgi:ribosome-associated heat shock protein Hsp15|nr:S4 domain-containing protein [Alphaproteobacteria bacterium]|tara:strand:+ start:59 stop:454 length:396 start_codon:yes stop_codon:yes gene_type:complete